MIVFDKEIVMYEGWVGIFKEYNEGEVYGLNEEYDFDLLFVLLSGNMWVNIYFLLIGFYVVYVFVGLLVFLFVFFFKFD